MIVYDVKTKVVYRDISKSSVDIAEKQYSNTSSDDYHFRFPHFERDFPDKFFNSYFCVRKKHCFKFSDEFLDILQLYETLEEKEKRGCFASFIFLCCVDQQARESPYILTFFMFSIFNFMKSSTLELEVKEGDCLLFCKKDKEENELLATFAREFFEILFNFFESRRISNLLIECGSSYWEMNINIENKRMVFSQKRKNEPKNEFLFAPSIYERILRYLFGILDRKK